MTGMYRSDSRSFVTPATVVSHTDGAQISNSRSIVLSNHGPTTSERHATVILDYGRCEGGRPVFHIDSAAGEGPLIVKITYSETVEGITSDTGTNPCFPPAVGFATEVICRRWSLLPLLKCNGHVSKCGTQDRAFCGAASARSTTCAEVSAVSKTDSVLLRSTSDLFENWFPTRQIRIDFEIEILFFGPAIKSHLEGWRAYGRHVLLSQGRDCACLGMCGRWYACIWAALGSVSPGYSMDRQACVIQGPDRGRRRQLGRPHGRERTGFLPEHGFKDA